MEAYNFQPRTMLSEVRPDHALTHSLRYSITQHPVSSCAVFLIVYWESRQSLMLTSPIALTLNNHICCLQVCQAMVHMADFPAFWTAIAEDGFYEEVIFYFSFSPLFVLRSCCMGSYSLSWWCHTYSISIILPFCSSILPDKNISSILQCHHSALIKFILSFS